MNTHLPFQGHTNFIPHYSYLIKIIQELHNLSFQRNTFILISDSWDCVDGIQWTQTISLAIKIS